jgi:hypothetical protein
MVALVAGMVVNIGVGDMISNDMVGAVCRVGGDDCGADPTSGTPTASPPAQSTPTPAQSTPTTSSGFPPETGSAASDEERLLTQTPAGRQALAQAKELGIKVVTGTTATTSYDSSKKQFYFNTNLPPGLNALLFAVQVGSARLPGIPLAPPKMTREAYIKSRVDDDVRRGEVAYPIYKQMKAAGQLTELDSSIAAFIDEGLQAYERGPTSFRQYVEAKNGTAYKSTWCTATYHIGTDAERACMSR